MPSSPLSSSFPYTTLFRSDCFALSRLLSQVGCADRARLYRLSQVHECDFDRCLVDHFSGLRVRHRAPAFRVVEIEHTGGILHLDRKSTRLNSSHTVISYAVFAIIFILSLHDALPI